MNPTHEPRRALAIGNAAIDEFYRNGTLERVQPGGTAFNVASWFSRHGFRASLCSTLGSDFPDPTDIDTSLCEVAAADSPRCRVRLNESGAPEERTWVEGDSSPRAFGPVEGRFDVAVLTSGRSEFSTPFETVSAPIKGFALDPLVHSYPPDRLATYLTEADYLFVNRTESGVLADKLDTGFAELPVSYDLQAAVETSRTRVRRADSTGTVATTGFDPIETPVDTTGAGDAFAATFLIETVRGVAPDVAIRSGHEAAVWTISSVGARPFDRTVL